MSIVDVRIKALQRQIQNLVSFLTQPKGVFETLDSMIKTTRLANQETLKTLGIKIPSVSGQASRLGIIREIERRVKLPRLGIIRR